MHQIKVDRVCSVEEAIILRDLGADIIGISLDSQSVFSDHRTVSFKKALSISRKLTRVKTCLILEKGFTPTERFILKAAQAKFSYIQIYINLFPEYWPAQEIRDSGLDIIYEGLTANYDDDPSWVVDSFRSDRDFTGVTCQIDLMDGIGDGWNFFTQETPKYPDEELQIQDVNDICKKTDSFITIDLTPENIHSVLNSFPEALGAYMTLGANPSHNCVHYFSFDQVVSVLRQLKEGNPKKDTKESRLH